MNEEIVNILREMYILATKFVELTGLTDEDCNGDYTTPKMPDIAENLDTDILNDISCLHGDLKWWTKWNDVK